uniref:Paraquat-inducible protein A n=1 Tax=Pseudictyota dubia TaxID=2749911 RepID=A0A7R9VHE8_9STRA|mmetsp:Transcript_14511/g.27675  ORF Transcript_14511/g.27675 Transcript_14511/m.27675 type:complete len:924 (+) Transcript_14511:350-3121(+)
MGDDEGNSSSSPSGGGGGLGGRLRGLLGGGGGGGGSSGDGSPNRQPLLNEAFSADGGDEAPAPAVVGPPPSAFAMEMEVAADEEEVAYEDAAEEEAAAPAPTNEGVAEASGTEGGAGEMEMEEPSPYASIIRERYLKEQAAERAREQAANTAAAADGIWEEAAASSAETATGDGTDDAAPAPTAAAEGGNNNRERAESTPESLDIDLGDANGDNEEPSRRGRRGRGLFGGRKRSARRRGGPQDAGSSPAVGSGEFQDEVVAAGPPDHHGSDDDRYSLALSPSTSCLSRLLVPLLILLAHGLFVYGQLAPMWRLRLFAHIDAWANAVQPVARRTMEAVGLPWNNHVTYDYDGDVETFTYGFAVKRLWAADGMDQKFGPKLSAVLLVLFSGAWPHVKLLLLHLNFWAPRRAKARTGALYWLSGFGKWSLADVLVVCVMIAIVHLDWDVDPGAIRDGVSRDLPLLVNIAKKLYTPSSACDALLHEPCSQHTNPKCWLCVHTLSIMMDHPDWAQGAGRDILQGFETKGGGQASLRIAGMKGIYVFCAAATLSLLIGVLVDWLDHKARHHRAEQRRNPPEPLETIDFESSALEAPRQDEEVPPELTGPPPSASRRSKRAAARLAPRPGRRRIHHEPLLRHGTHTLPSRGANTMHLLNRVPAGSPFSSEHSYTLLFFGSLLTLLLVVLAAVRPTMERQVYGAGPKLLNEVLGVQWQRTFSLWSLTEVTGDAGGADYLLLATFALFVLVGPIVRAILVVIDLAFPMKESSHDRLTYAINVVGAFCAWDVLAVAAVMVMLEMPSITDTIIVRPECALVPSEDVADAGQSCLEVQFNLLPSFFWLVLPGGLLLLLISVAAVRMGMRATDPYGDGDEGGPYLCGCVMEGGCLRKPCSCCCGGGRNSRAAEDPHAYALLGGDGGAEEEEGGDVI